MTIKDLANGQTARVETVGGEGNLRQHFLDMGLIPGQEVTLEKRAPMGDPIQIKIEDYSLTLRLAEAQQIEVVPVTAKDSEKEKTIRHESGYSLSLDSHPGYGEGGIYHNKEHESPLPKGETLTFALVGQQNCGKTTLFNQLTGSNQHVGNFPGVTVDRKDGQIRGYSGTLVTDLPGIYSLSTYTEEERVSREFILKEKPKAIINILDAGNLERNLYLTVQLMELGVPMVLALNMMDEVRGNGGSVDINKMEEALGLPVVPIAAAKGEGIDELVEHAIHIAKYQEAPVRQDFCDPGDFGGAVHRTLHSIMHIVEDHAASIGLPVRFVADRIVEGDEEIIKALNLHSNDLETIEHLVVEMERARGLDRHAAMADMRFEFIKKLCHTAVVKPHESREHRLSRRIDKVLTGRFTAIPAFIAIIALVFWLTFDVVGAWLQTLLDGGITWLAGIVSDAFVRLEVSEPVRSLVVDAVFGGVGSVVSFLPIIVVLFFFLSILEDSGYMARIAFVSDKMLRKIGLSGRSIVPMLISFGCSVPGVMSARTLSSSRDRKMTILMTPFMSCSAKIAIYGFFASAFFPGNAALVMISLYLLGILLGVTGALIVKTFRRHKETSPFVMELPNYRLPVPKNVAMLLWDKTKDFLQRAFTVIFVATICIWVLENFDFRLTFVQDSQNSILAWIAGLLSPVFSPIGLGDWRIVTSLISGVMAKESVVSTMEVLGVAGLLCTQSAVSMLVFCLLYTPCVAALAAIRRELGGGWAVFVAFFQLFIAWLTALAAYNIAGLI